MPGSGSLGLGAGAPGGGRVGGGRRRSRGEGGLTCQRRRLSDFLGQTPSLHHTWGYSRICLWTSRNSVAPNIRPILSQPVWPRGCPALESDPLPIALLSARRTRAQTPDVKNSASTSLTQSSRVPACPLRRPATLLPPTGPAIATARSSEIFKGTYSYRAGSCCFRCLEGSSTGSPPDC